MIDEVLDHLIVLKPEFDLSLFSLTLNREGCGTKSPHVQEDPFILYEWKTCVIL